MTLDTYVRALMARFAIEEGYEYGGVNNMLAVAFVLRNRVFGGWGDWLEVVTTAPQKRANLYLPPIPNIRSNNVRVILNRIDEIYTRTDVNDFTGGALFYVDPTREMAPWFKTEVLDRPEDHQRSAHVGPVWFFK